MGIVSICYNWVKLVVMLDHLVLDLPGVHFLGHQCGLGGAENWGIMPLFYAVVCLELSS